MKIKHWHSLLLFCTAILFIACNHSGNDGVFDPLIQLGKDTVAIDSYLASQGVAPTKDVTGVRMVITKLGEGLPASYYLNPTVKVEYVGKLLSNGTIFDQGTVTGTVKTYIVGWQIALGSLPVGTIADIYIPSGYAYGNTSQRTIPANSVLVFHITFHEIIVPTAQTTQFKTDTAAINKSLGNFRSLYEVDSTGLRFRTIQPGTGDKPGLYDRVRVNYSFRLLSDTTTVVSSYSRRPTKQFYSRVVDFLPAMQDGLQKMNKGSKARLYAPSSLGFGTNTIQDSTRTKTIIPPNSSLVVDVELIDIFK
jgi:FKBP-type peptidyl-prolyl cis-trans isomerase FkpA